MKKLKKKIIFILIALMIITPFANSYANSSEITKENLAEAFDKFVASDSNENNYKINLLDDEIEVTSEKRKNILKYDLTDKPTFYNEALIEDGMTYEQFGEATSGLSLPMLGYFAVANIKGVEFEDSMAYYTMSYLMSGLSSSGSSNSSYIVIDDLNMSEGVTMEKDTSNPKIIYASDFPERVMEYVNDKYKDKMVFNDSIEDGIGSYELTIERTDVTENSCKIVSSMTIDTDVDFEGIKDYNKKVEDNMKVEEVVKREDADYVIDLKVGQKCIIQSEDGSLGYSLSGNNCCECDVSGKRMEILGTSAGKSTGYIYIGDTEKTIYITVEENTNNENLATIFLNVSSKTTQKNENNSGSTNNNNSNNNNSNTNNNASSNKNQTTNDTTTSNKILPNTGINTIILITLVITASLMIILFIKLRTLKEIK